VREAVGIAQPASGEGIGGLILHYTGGRWVKESWLANIQLQKVAMLSASDGWAIGDDESFTPTRSVLLHYNGKNWTQVHVPGTALVGISMLSASDGWIVGNTATPSANPATQGQMTVSSFFLHYDGRSWTQTQTLNTTLGGISMDSASDGWAFGQTIDLLHPENSQNLMWHYDGRQWTEVQTPATHLAATVLGICMDAPTDGWAVGYWNQGKGDQFGTSLYLHYSAGKWTQVQGPGYLVYDVALTSPGEGWAASDGPQGPLAHYLNGTWSVYQP
jgi:hypothetical protein